jgi:hypothetical protein
VRIAVTGGGSSSGEVERLEPWQLAPYLQTLQGQGVTEVIWNRERMAIAAALEQARGVGPTATVVADGTALYVAEPDHSPDETPGAGPAGHAGRPGLAPPGVVPIQLSPRGQGPPRRS